MELIDWGKVLTVVVAGVGVVAATWVLIVLGTILFRNRRRLPGGKKEEVVEKPAPHPGGTDLVPPFGEERKGHQAGGEGR